jgi:eukaryotic-like serine/threonine-protein kinase
MNSDIVSFIRKKDYLMIKELGRGACGKTILLTDDFIHQDFVCKKYCPFDLDTREELFLRFIDEIKILHLLYHQNIVRVFNYYIYPSIFAGYILMEYIEGDDIQNYLLKNPEKINDVFYQTISGFKYLEENNILHRDIRNQNILVRKDGIVKIIDFGFGKQIDYKKDFNKSISLNWWCELPNEFSEQKYDFKTEVYFIGKLFDKIINELKIEYFQYNKILKMMCEKNANNRISSFNEIYNEILNNKFIEIDFNEEEIDCYRIFSETLVKFITKIKNGTKYFTNLDNLQKSLEDLYNKIMLEEYLPLNSQLSQCFIDGEYYFEKDYTVPVHIIKSFIMLLRSCPNEKKYIILCNIHSKLDSIKRYSDGFIYNDNIPF